MARKAGENEELWGIKGLSMISIMRYPNQHCKMTEKILRENAWPEEYIRAVISHGWGLVTDIEPKTRLEKTLFAIDVLNRACCSKRYGKTIKKRYGYEPSFGYKENGTIKGLPPESTGR
jgi:predicted hydrolase (HD superfamily)